VAVRTDDFNRRAQTVRLENGSWLRLNSQLTIHNLHATTAIYHSQFQLLSIIIASRAPGAFRGDSVMSCPHAARMSRPRLFRTDTDCP
jgi:hypothetical protein